MVASGFVTEDQRSIFHAASHHLLEDQDVAAVTLGGTDLALAFNEQTAAISRELTVRAFMSMRLHGWQLLEELRPSHLFWFSSPCALPSTHAARHRRA
jgi:hypothetical protein